LSVFIFITSFVFSPAYGELIHIFDDPTPTSGDLFGLPVSVSGNNVLVGARFDDTNGSSVGQAHLFDAVSGDLLLTFDDPTVTENCNFGRSVSIDGVNALIAGCGGVSGQAYLFNVTTCDDDTSNGGTAGDKHCEAAFQTYDNPAAAFGGWGSSTSIDGNNVVVGNDAEKINGLFAVGQAYLFNAKTGELLLTLDSPKVATGQQFGRSVSIDGELVVVGAIQFNLNDGFNHGRAYMYIVTTCDADTSNGGTAGDKVCEAAFHTFDDPSPTIRDKFGASVSIDGTNVLVGDPEHRTGATLEERLGQAYLFSAKSGNLLLTFDDPSNTVSDFFGSSVSIDGNNVVVGAPGDDNTFTESGEVYLYDAATCDADTSNGGTAGDKVCEAALKTIPGQSPSNSPCPSPPVPCIIPNFGSSVSIDGNNVVVGEPFLAFLGLEPGRAYLFEINGDTCMGMTPTITGTPGDDVLTGTAGPDVIIGFGGNDVINALDGNDIVCAGSGNDMVEGNKGNDTLLGEDGNDFINGGKGTDTIMGGAGNDLLLGFKGIDTIMGGAGDDYIQGQGNNDKLSGGADNDAVQGDGGADDIDGDAGDDKLDGAGGNDTINGGTEDDILVGAGGADTMDGGANNDSCKKDGADPATANCEQEN